MNIKTTLTLLVLSAALGAMTAATQAQTPSTWTGAGTGDWNTSGNWSSGVPNGNFAATFDTAGEKTINVSSAVNIRQIVLVTGQTGGVNLSGERLTFNQGGANNLININGLPLTINNPITFTTQLNVNPGATIVLNGDVTSSGSTYLRKINSEELRLFGDNSGMTATTTVGGRAGVGIGLENGSLIAGSDTALGTGVVLFSANNNNKNIVASGRTIANDLIFDSTGGTSRLRAARGTTATFSSSSIGGTYQITLTDDASGSGDATIRFTGTALTVGNAVNITNTTTVFELGNASGTQAWNGNVTGNGRLVKTGAGSATLAGTNSFTGTTVVTGGTLRLNTATGGSALGSSGALNVTNATVLISKSDQVNNGATISLSGATIRRESGVSETFGNLTVNGNSTLDFDTGTEGTLAFNTYANGGSFKLTLDNFFTGNVLTFNSNLTNSIAVGTYNTTSFTSGDGWFEINSISGGFTTAWNGSTFTITAIPEPSTVLVAGGLVALLGGAALRRRRRRDA